MAHNGIFICYLLPDLFHEILHRSRTREASGWNSSQPSSQQCIPALCSVFILQNPVLGLWVEQQCLGHSMSLILGDRKAGDGTSHCLWFPRSWSSELVLGDLCSLTTLPCMCSSQEDGCTLVKVSHSLNLGQTLKQMWASLLPQEETWFLHELDVKISRAWLTSPPNSNCKGKTQRAWASGMTKMSRGKWGFLSPLQEPERHMLLRT